MLCGQGSSGKSTFGKYLKNNLPDENIEFIQVDKIVGTEHLEPYHLKEYINQLQNAIDKDISCIADFSQDTIGCRKNILKDLNLSTNPNIDFVTVSMRPQIDDLISWDIKRRNIDVNEDYAHRIHRIYNCFEFPQDKEFEKYNFNSIKHFIIKDKNDYDNIIDFISKKSIVCR